MACSYLHNHMIATIKRLYPGALHGVDFLVGHPLDPQTGEHIGLPWIASWKRAEPQPSDRSIHEAYAKMRDEIHAEVERAYRDACLRDSDHRTSVPPDAPPAVQARAAAWIEWREKLRAAPKQEGWPYTHVWPDAPQE